ncbi:MAG: ABC transporter substrate-binding protein [Gammaproteobacteria bacterium]|nr:ABC transporter substrate-binding protein [Gammaproteobacteria bacterium]
MKRLAIVVAGLSFGAAAAVAEPATVHPPDQTIREATERVQALIRQNHAKYKADQKAFYAMVENEIVPRFDLPYIAQLILARHWRQATPEQRARFQAAFKNMLIRSYADALLEYRESVKAEWQPVRAEDNATDVTVKSTLLRDGAPPVPLGFAMRLSDNQWKVYDITIEAVSLVSSFRSQISAEVKKSGLDGVIERIERGDLETPKTEGVPG